MLCLAGCLHPAPRAVLREAAGSAAEVGPRLDNYGQATAPRDGVIVVRGDDFLPAPPSQDASIKGRPGKSISLAEALARTTSLKVIDQEQAGETIADAEERLDEEPVGNLLVICYGFGDAVAQTNMAQFKATLRRMIRSAQARGAAVYLVVEPATTLPRSATVEPYRNAVRVVAGAEGAGVIDAPPALAAAGLGPSKVKIQPNDAVKLIAGLIRRYIKIAPVEDHSG
jgi:hypothetical protein